MNDNYYLLPFDFTRVAGKEVIVNEVGDMMIVPNGTVGCLVNRSIKRDDLFKSLVANFFVSEELVPSSFDIYASRLREKKLFMDHFTALHIFVVTLRCNQNCVYCQASSRKENSEDCSMSKEIMKRSVEMMFHSPSPILTMEFQGGEPSLHPEIIRYGIELAEKKRLDEGRKVRYVLCTNCVNLTDEILEICKRYHVLISTSLDGPAFLHNSNRGKVDSYEKVVVGIEKARSVLGNDQVSALMTTSMQSLNFPVEIVDEYVKLGFNGLFLRALNPYGLASDNPNWEEYTNRFVDFYKMAFEHILELNRKGVHFVEEFAVIVLRKMLTPFCTGFVDLQSPAGIVNSVLVYNYDGNLYASDESRMLAEKGDYSFCLGSVFNPYEELVYGKKVRQWAQVWTNEALAGCSDCAFRNYCGADPVRNHSTQGDIYGHRSTSLLCKKNKAIIEYLVSLIVEREDEVMSIFKSWLR